MQISNMLFQQVVPSVKSPPSTRPADRVNSFENALSSASSRNEAGTRRVERNSDRNDRGDERREDSKKLKADDSKGRLEEIKSLLEAVESEDVGEALLAFISYLLDSSIDLDGGELGELGLEELVKELEDLVGKLGELDLSQVQSQGDLDALVKTVEMANDLLTRLEGQVQSEDNVEGKLKVMEKLNIEELRTSLELLKIDLNTSLLREGIASGLEDEQISLLQLKDQALVDGSSRPEHGESLRAKSKSSRQGQSKAPEESLEEVLIEEILEENKSGEEVNLRDRILQNRINFVTRQGFDNLEDKSLQSSADLGLEKNEVFELDKLLFSQNFKNDFNHTMQAIVNKETVTEQNFLNMDKLDIIKQISSKIGINGVDSASEIKIKLTPESLGAMTIRVTLEDGVVSARAIVENPHVKELMESNIALLRDSLKSQGVEFQKIDVFVGEDPSEGKQPNQSGFEQGSDKRRNGQGSDEVELEDVEGILNGHIVTADRVDTVV